MPGPFEPTIDIDWTGFLDRFSAVDATWLAGIAAIVIVVGGYLTLGPHGGSTGRRIATLVVVVVVGGGVAMMLIAGSLAEVNISEQLEGW